MRAPPQSRLAAMEFGYHPRAARRSPDEAKRDPGAAAAEAPRIALRFIRATAETRRRGTSMPDAEFTIWGRANSVNVQKVLWCLAELAFRSSASTPACGTGKTREADYLAMNPNARMRDTSCRGRFRAVGDPIRSCDLCLAQGGGTPIYPEARSRRARSIRWLDWTLSTVQPVDRPVFWASCARRPPSATWSRCEARCRCRRRGRARNTPTACCAPHAASSKASSSRSPISRSAPMRGVGSASRGSPGGAGRIWRAGSPSSANARRICANVAPPMS